MTIPELPLERFAELSAELDAGVSREQVLAEAGLTPEVWAGTQEHWLGKIAAEATRKRFDLTTRYTKAFSARRRVLADAARAGAGPLTRAAHVPPAAPALGAPPSATPAQPPPPFDVAAAVAPPAFFAAPPAYVANEAASGDPPPAFVSTTDPAPPPRAAIPDGPEGAPGGAVSNELGRTVVAMSPFAFGGSMPFRGGAGKPPSTPPSVAAGGLPFRAPGADSGPVPAPGTAPFRDGGVPSETAAPPEPAPKRAKTETLSGGEFAALRAEPLPFRRTDSSPSLRATSPVPGAALGGLPFQGAPAASPPPAGGSAPPPPRSPDLEPTFAPPVAPVAPPAAPVARLPLARFAQMTAESQLWPAALAAIRARYGLDEAGYSAENEAWQCLFLSDAALYARYGSLLAHYRDWLAKSAR